MKLQGKRIAFLGDSITFGHGTTQNCMRFTDRIALQQGCTTYNHGVNGTRFAVQRHADSEDAQGFYRRLFDLPQDVDCVVVFGGTNDYGHGDAPLGTFADRTPATFYGACHFIMRSLLEKYVSVPLVFLTPLHRVQEDVSLDPRKAGSSASLADYRAIIQEVATYYALPVLDLYATSGIQPCVPAIAQALCPDGLHPNDDGHALLTERITQFLLAL